jgi:hypothetical protein
MADFFQNGTVTTLHNLDRDGPARLVRDLLEFTECSPVTLVLPALYTEFEHPAMSRIVEELEGARLSEGSLLPWVRRARRNTCVPGHSSAISEPPSISFKWIIPESSTCSASCAKPVLMLAQWAKEVPTGSLILELRSKIAEKASGLCAEPFGSGPRRLNWGLVDRCSSLRRRSRMRRPDIGSSAARRLHYPTVFSAPRRAGPASRVCKVPGGNWGYPRGHERVNLSMDG